MDGENGHTQAVIMAARNPRIIAKKVTNDKYFTTSEKGKHNLFRPALEK